MTLPRFLRHVAFLLLPLCSVGAMAAEPLPSDTSEVRRQEERLSELFRNYYATMNVDSALIVLDELIALRHSQGNPEMEMKARWNKIALLNNSSHYDSLLVVAGEEMVWFEAHGFMDRFYQAWQRKCSANHDQGRMQTALREAKAMHEDAQRRNNNTGRAMAYKQMGITYYDIRQLDQAAEAFRHSIELLQEEGDSTGILSGVYDGLCQTLDRQRHYGEELRTSEEWLDHLSSLLKSNAPTQVAPTFVSCHLAHAAAHIGMKDYEQAEADIHEAEKYYSVIKSVLPLYYIYEMYVRLWLAQGMPQKALAYADSIGRLDITVDSKIDELRGEALMQTGQGQRAAEIFRKLYTQKDSIFTRDMRTQLDELNTLLGVDEMEREKERAQYLFTIVVALLLVAAMIVYILTRRQAAKRLAQKNQELAERNEELRKANLKAEESSKMKSEFIKNISHEIRTPLNILNGFTQVLTTPGIEMSESEAADLRQRIEENTLRITDLVNKMLELSDASSHTVISRSDETTPRLIATQASTGLDIDSHPSLQYVIDIDDDAAGLRLQTNTVYAVRCLTLLLDNALKFTEKGRVRLAVSRTEEACLFAVEDTGIGVPAEECEHIFEEFVQLDSYYDGTGIGLAVARSIARRLGGDVVLDTAYKEGARFLFTLPLAS